MRAADHLVARIATHRQPERRDFLFLAAMTLVVTFASPAAAQRPSPDDHVPEMAAFLRQVQIAAPISHRRLAVYPVLLEDRVDLSGKWWTLDEALRKGELIVREKGRDGTVSRVEVENRSRERYVLILSGEVLSGGKQTRTVRNDVVVGPGQEVELSVLCVEEHRWKGGERLSASGTFVPQSLAKSLRMGADQRRLWREIARNNADLKTETATGSLEKALKSDATQRKLSEVRKRIVPNVPRGSVGFIFVSGTRAVGADFFGRESLARELLPKLLDSYAVDFVVKQEDSGSGRNDRAAIDFYERVVRAGSSRAKTEGSGAGIQTRASALLGDGVSLGGTLVHYGVQVEEKIIYPRPVPQRR